MLHFGTCPESPQQTSPPATSHLAHPRVLYDAVTATAAGRCRPASSGADHPKMAPLLFGLSAKLPTQTTPKKERKYMKILNMFIIVPHV